MARDSSGKFSSWPTDFALIVIGLLLIVACEHIG